MEIALMFAAGQRWTYRAPQGFEASRIVIGAVVTFGHAGPTICVAVSLAPHRLPDGRVEAGTIAFLPFSEAALQATVLALDGSDVPPPAFAGEMESWARDPRGLTTFTVPFDGFLDKLIGRQMAQIVGINAAAT